MRGSLGREECRVEEGEIYLADRIIRQKPGGGRQVGERGRLDSRLRGDE